MHWRVRNFKGIRDAEVDLSPGKATFLVGVNSSGKSSLTQSILLLAQSQYDRGPLILNGPLVQLGTPADVINENALGRVHFTISDEPIRRRSIGVTAEYELGSLSTAEDLQIRTVRAVDSSGNQTLLSRDHAPTKDLRLAREAGHANFHLHVKNAGTDRRPLRAYVGFDGFRPTELIILFREDQIKAQVKAQLRALLGREGDTERARILSLYTYLQLVEEMSDDEDSFWATPAVAEWRDAWSRNPGLAIESWRELDPDMQKEIVEKLSTERARRPYVRLDLQRGQVDRYWHSDPLDAVVAPTFSVLTRILDRQREIVDRLASKVQYLGPLRDEPRVVWSQWNQLARGLPVGRRGELTAALLARKNEGRIEYFAPDGSARFGRASDAIDEWLAYLEIGSGAMTEDRGKLGVAMQVSHLGKRRDLTAVGVGVSQALPVVVSVLTVQRGSILFLEQPELHLHPAVQARLADFFLTARRDIALVVETHSESMVTRARRRAAEGELDPDRLDLVFVEPTESGSNSRRIEVTTTGDLTEWPAGFIAASSEDIKKIFEANMAKRTRGGA